MAALTASCARCRFGAGETPAVAPPSYAFVLALGADSACEWAKAEAWASLNVEMGATSFCRRCRRVCWLARDPDAQSALLQHLALRRECRAYAAHVGQHAA